jgi:hypothetical protein
MTTKPTITVQQPNVQPMKKILQDNKQQQRMFLVFSKIWLRHVSAGTRHKEVIQNKKRNLRSYSVLPFDALFRPKQFATKFLYTFNKKKALFR